MSGIFSENEYIDIELNYTIDKNKHGAVHMTVLDDEKAAKMKADPITKDKVQTLRSQWRTLTWEASNQLLARSTVYNHQTQTQDIDYTKFRHAKITSCLVDWDAKDEKGAKVPCVEAYINKLHANIAVALLAKYDEAITTNSDDQVKN